MGKKKESGENLFNAYYEEIYLSRWESIKSSLLESEKIEKITLDGLSKDYFMDKASIFVATTLDVKSGEIVLDMCAAPGGKTLVLALSLNGEGSLTSNDRSPDRRVRLKNVISSCLDPKYSSIITVTGFDASKWGLYEKNKYDKILLDAPCSSEAHVLNSNKHLSLWTPARPKRLSKEQFSILSSAFLALKEGGTLLYSTCSINPIENEENIERLITRHKDELEEVLITNPIGERKKYGYLVLPDKDKMGPMYYCKLRKK